MDGQGGPITDAPPLTRWRLVLVAAALAQILFEAVIVAVNGSVARPAIVWSALLTIGLVVLRRRRRTGAAILGFVSLAHFATSAAFLAESLVHPESFWDFWLGWSIVLTAGLGLLAAAAVWRREDDGSNRARAVSLGIMGLIVALGIVAGVTSIAYESEAAQDEDLALSARNLEFEPANLSADSGEIAVFVDNADSFRHTFSIDALNVDLEIPGGKATRVEFIAEPGTYEFYCAVPGHEDMKGVLVVNGQ
jgi:plastocyanin